MKNQSDSGFTIVALLLGVILLAGGFILGSVYLGSMNSKKTEPQNTPALSETASLQLSDRLTQLEGQFKSNKVDKSLADRLGALEEQFKQVNSKLQESPSPTASVNIPVTYIPIGSIDGTVTSINLVNFGQLNFSIDPGDYPGYKTMQLIGDLRVNAGGIAHARLYNDSDQKDVPNSEISTSSTTLSSITSSAFTLPSSKKTYRLQGKSDAGDQIFLQNIKIKVSY